MTASDRFISAGHLASRVLAAAHSIVQLETCGVAASPCIGLIAVVQQWAAHGRRTFRQHNLAEAAVRHAWRRNLQFCLHLLFHLIVCFVCIYLSSIILPYSFAGLLVYMYPPLGPFQGSMTHFSHTAPFGLIPSLSAPPGLACSTTVTVAVPVNAVQPIYQTTRRHTSEHISSEVESVDGGWRTVRYVSVSPPTLLAATARKKV